MSKFRLGSELYITIHIYLFFFCFKRSGKIIDKELLHFALGLCFAAFHLQAEQRFAKTVSLDFPWVISHS